MAEKKISGEARRKAFLPEALVEDISPGIESDGQHRDGGKKLELAPVKESTVQRLIKHFKDIK
jgi:hypothetical protein